jgi:hypothetical protein
MLIAWCMTENHDRARCIDFVCFLWVENDILLCRGIARHLGFLSTHRMPKTAVGFIAWKASLKLKPEGRSVGAGVGWGGSTVELITHTVSFLV